MEWSDFSSYSPFDEDLYGLLSPPPHTPNSSGWTSDEEVKLHYTPLQVNNNISNNTNTNNNVGEIMDQSSDSLVPAVEEEDENAVVPRNRRTRTGQPRRRGVPWTEEEHQLFLMGLNKYGKGDWRSISRYYVINKTPTQVASHAQKFFRRRTSCTPPDRRRPSIHDVQTVNPPFSATHSALPFSSPALIPPIQHNFNGTSSLLHQNCTFMQPSINSAFPASANYGSASNNSSYLVNSNWGWSID